MPIKGVTDLHNSDDFPGKLATIGTVWKGEKKGTNSIGSDLGTKLRVEIEDENWRNAFLRHYGTLTPEQINIYLPFRTVDRCFETWFASFSAKGFIHKCDGEKIVEKMVDEPYKTERGETRYHRTKKKVDEPCQKGDSPFCSACNRASGLLYFYVAELYSASGSTKGFRMSIGGANDLPKLYEQLVNLHNSYGTLCGSPVPSPLTMGYIPFVLSRVKTPITKPLTKAETVNGKKLTHHTGGRSQSHYYALSISEDPEWLDRLQKFYQEQELLRLSQYPQLARLYGVEPISQIALPAAPPASLPSSPRQRQLAAATTTIEAPSSVNVSAEIVEEDLPLYLNKTEWASIWNRAAAAGFSVDAAKLCLNDMGIPDFRSIPVTKQAEVLRALSSVDRANFYKAKLNPPAPEPDEEEFEDAEFEEPETTEI